MRVHERRESRGNQKEEMEMALFFVSVSRMKLKINHQLKFKTKGV
jgi:hypothetical protein